MASTKSDENKLIVFEMKISCGKYGPKSNDEGDYEIKSKKELINDPSIVTMIKSQKSKIEVDQTRLES